MRSTSSGTSRLHDRPRASTGVKHERARSLVERLWQERTGAVSTQILQELYVSLRRKAGRPLASEGARAVVADYLRWEVDSCCAWSSAIIWF